MHLSERFLKLVQQQMAIYQDDHELCQLVVYVAHSSKGNTPSLEAIGQWPESNKVLQPVEDDPDLRKPSMDRRWYPLQEGSILLGVLRAERIPSSKEWSESLDQQLQSTALTLTSCLGLELDRNRLIDELSQYREQIAAMVHQLRNPLSALRTYAKLLLRKLGPESQHRSLVEGLLTEQDQLNRYLVNLDQLNSISLPKSLNGPKSLLLPPSMSVENFSSIKSLIEPLLERASVTANLQGRKWYGNTIWPEWTQNTKSIPESVIAEIIANLLENAFRYSPESSAIGLHINDQGICIWDSGPSIIQEEREKIFNKGYRGSRSSELSGTGLGLALGRQLADGLGGELKLIKSPFDFHPSLPKEGNAFVFKLPLRLIQ